VALNAAVGASGIPSWSLKTSLGEIGADEHDILDAYTEVVVILFVSIVPVLTELKVPSIKFLTLII